MSVKITRRVWEVIRGKKERYTSSDSLVLLAIADHADDRGFAYPSIELLAEETNLSTRQVMRILKKLQEYGDLYVDQREAHNRYIVTIGMSAEELLEALGTPRLQYSLSEISEIAARLHPTQRTIFPKSNRWAPRVADDESIKTPPRDMNVTSQPVAPEISRDTGVTYQPPSEAAPRVSRDVDDTRSCDTHVTSEVTHMSPKPSINHQYEPSVNNNNKAEGVQGILQEVQDLYRQEIAPLTPLTIEELGGMVLREPDIERWRWAFRTSVGKVARWAWIKRVITNPIPPAEYQRLYPPHGRRASSSRPSRPYVINGEPTLEVVESDPNVF